MREISEVLIGRGIVTVKRFATGNYSFEVLVPATGTSLDEMREAAETAKALWDELEEKFNPSQTDDEIPY